MNNEFVLTQDDIDAIKKAIEKCVEKKTDKIWDQEELSPVKQKIKESYRGILGERCCYCCRNIYGEFKFVLDIEHVLPKSKYLHYALSPFNLSVACKRCNMQIKKDDTSFLVNKEDTAENAQDSINYRFIHPNLDVFFDHLCYESTIRNDVKLVKYFVNNESKKGEYTYNYFDLKALEIDTVNKAQGVEVPAYSDLIGKEVIEEIETELKKLKKA